MNLQGQRIYLGGPIDVPGGELAAYDEATRQLQTWGARVLNPHDFGLAEDDVARPRGVDALRAALEADADALHQADLVIVLPGGDPVAEAMAATFGLPVASLVPARPAPAPAAAARVPARFPAPRKALESLPVGVSSGARRPPITRP